MGYKYRGESKYPNPPKRLPTVAEYEYYLDKLEKVMPMTREEIIRRAVEKYYIKKILDKQSWHINAILRDQEHKCFYCGKILSTRTATIDHKTPVSRGGSNQRENVVAACDKCNNDKESMTVEEYFLFLKQQSTGG